MDDEHEDGHISTPPLLTPGHMGQDFSGEGWIEGFHLKNRHEKVRLSPARYSGGERASRSPGRSISLEGASSSERSLPTMTGVNSDFGVNTSQLHSKLDRIEAKLGQAVTTMRGSTSAPASIEDCSRGALKALSEAKYHALFMHDTLQRALQVSLKTSVRFTDQYHRGEVEGLNGTLQTKAVQATAAMDSLAQGLDAIAVTLGSQPGAIQRSVGNSGGGTANGGDNRVKKGLQDIIHELREVLCMMSLQGGSQSVGRPAETKEHWNGDLKVKARAQKSPTPLRDRPIAEPREVEPPPRPPHTPLEHMTAAHFDELTRLRIEVRRLKKENAHWERFSREQTAHR